MKHNLLPIIIWVVVIGAAFALAWYKGYVLRFRNYWNETGDELRKCAWPTWDELKGSTVVVMISIAILGAYTIGVDFVLALFVRWMTQI